MATQKLKTPSALFAKVVREALKHYHDAAWLGEQSSLATPYFLGRKLVSPTLEHNTATGRGRTLQKLLYEAATAIWADELPPTRTKLVATVDAARAQAGNKGPQYAFLLLELRYFRKYFSKFSEPLTAKECAKFLTVSEARFFIHVERAIDTLAAVLLRRMHPTFRLERPTVRGPVLGRADRQQAALHHLRQTEAVMLSGISGIGKTTLGATIFANWHASPAFWLTIRPGLNDQLNSVIFTLAHFLHQHGRSALWLQLMADGGHLARPEHLLGYLEHDLQIQPLLCFDEVDRLNTLNREHTAIVELLDSLKTRTPLLLIGQKPAIDTPVHYQLGGLSLADATELLRPTLVTLPPAVVATWQRVTHGNPRLLKLYAMLSQDGELVEPHGADLSGPFQRLWRRLSRAEQQLLAMLSVFRAPVPLSAWASQTGSVAALIQRDLIQRTVENGIWVTPIYRDYLYRQILLQETREQYHAQAAQLRARYGEYTLAAFHYYQAGEPAKAVAIWYAHRETEIARGFAATARDLFVNISAKQLSAAWHKKLRVIRNQLFELAGQLTEIVMDAPLETPVGDLTLEDVLIGEQTGRAWTLLGQPDRALQAYDVALDELAQLMRRSAQLRFRRSQLFRQDGELRAARQEARAIYAIYRRLQGTLAQQTGDFVAAEDDFLAALQSAEQLPSERAALNYELAILYGKQGRIELGRQHAQLAMRYYVEIGHRLLKETVQMDLAGMHLQVGEFANVIRYGEPTLQFFRSIRHQAAVSSLLNNLAEAYFELGDMQKALSYAQEVIYSEERGVYPYASYTLGRIHVRNKAYAYAHVAFEEGLKVALRNEDTFIRAYLLRERGWLCQMQQETIRGRADLDAASVLFMQMKMPHEARRCDEAA